MTARASNRFGPGPSCAHLPMLLAGVLALGACGGGGGGDDGGGGNGGGGGGGGGGGTPGSPVTISGKARYEFPPPTPPSCNGLDFDALQQRPIRQATIELLAAADDSVLDAGVTDDNGDFSLTVDSGIQVYIRVRAELKRTGAPSWDVEVRDNTVTETAAGTPLPLPQRPLYVLDTAVFDSGTADLTHDVTALTGWNASTNSYTGTRAAAPFAVLDVAYAGMLLVLGTEPQASFEPLDVFWSVNNRPAEDDIDAGDIGTSHYSPDGNQLFLLGDAGSDPDEFDDHVVAHEWGHYYEDTFSRSDSIGGAHSLGDRLDMRVAFGEGWATALSGMALENPIYCDTPFGLRIDIESDVFGTPGWFNEVSVLKVIYDLWDADIDGADSVSIGFDPIHALMTGAQATAPAFTSIFSFASALRTEQPAAAASIDSLLQGEGISAGGDAFGDNEANDGEAEEPLDVLPVYTTVAPDGVTREICSNSEFDRNGGDELNASGNKLAEHRFLRMTIDTAAQYHFEIITTNEDLPPDDPDDDQDQSDPDILIQLDGVVQNALVPGGNPQGFSPDANQEVFTTSNTLQAGEYVMALTEFRYHDEETPDIYPARTCFDVTITQAP